VIIEYGGDFDANTGVSKHYINGRLVPDALVPYLEEYMTKVSEYEEQIVELQVLSAEALKKFEDAYARIMKDT